MLKMILKVLSAIAEFDAAHLNDVEYKDITSQKCKLLLFWLFLALKDDKLKAAAPKEKPMKPKTN